MKYEWKKKEKDMYLPKAKPILITIPKFRFIVIEGVGNPGSEQFAACIEILYSLSYAIRMMPKSGFTPEGYFEYTVYPLEGIWDLTEKGIEEKKKGVLNKDELRYRMMIRQPDFVSEEIFMMAKDIVRKKKPNLELHNVSLEDIEEGLSVQMMHVGSFDSEQQTFDDMTEFIATRNIRRSSFTHREIYISDFRKTQQEKLKTVLRFQVEEKDGTNNLNI